MAQVSYGSVTITDITDITNVYLEYCMTVAGLSATQVKNKSTWTLPEITWGTTYPQWVSGYEIWIRQVTEKEGLPSEYGDPYLDNAINQLNQSLGSTDIALNALQSKLRKIWINETTNQSTGYVAGTYAASGIENINFDTTDPSTYGYNTLLRHNALDFRYNLVKMLSLTTNGLTIYKYPIPSGNDYIQNDKGLELTLDRLNFYGNIYVKTSDNAIDLDKFYYTRSLDTSTDTYVYTKVANPNSAYLSTYYEQVISAFIGNEGLQVNQGLIGSDANRIQLINNDNESGQIMIVGSSITFESLTELVDDENNIVYDEHGNPVIIDKQLTIASLVNQLEETDNILKNEDNGLISLTAQLRENLTQLNNETQGISNICDDYIIFKNKFNSVATINSSATKITFSNARIDTLETANYYWVEVDGKLYLRVK